MNATQPIPRRGRPRGGGQSEKPSDAVVRVRKALGLTQEEFAHELGCSISTLRRFEQLSVLPAGIGIKNAFAKAAKRAGISLEEVPQK